MLHRALAAVHQAMEEVTADGCASKVVAQLRAGWGHQRIERLVMLGLGPVSASAPARYQLALGLVLARELLGSGALLQATEHSTKSTVGIANTLSACHALTSTISRRDPAGVRPRIRRRRRRDAGCTQVSCHPPRRG